MLSLSVKKVKRLEDQLKGTHVIISKLVDEYQNSEGATRGTETSDSSILDLVAENKKLKKEDTALEASAEGEQENDDEDGYLVI